MGRFLNSKFFWIHSSLSQYFRQELPVNYVLHFCNYNPVGKEIMSFIIWTHLSWIRCWTKWKWFRFLLDIQSMERRKKTSSAINKLETHAQRWWSIFFHSTKSTFVDAPCEHKQLFVCYTGVYLSPDAWSIIIIQLNVHFSLSFFCPRLICNVGAKSALSDLLGRKDR